MSLKRVTLDSHLVTKMLLLSAISQWTKIGKIREINYTSAAFAQLKHLVGEKIKLTLTFETVLYFFVLC